MLELSPESTESATGTRGLTHRSAAPFAEDRRARLATVDMRCPNQARYHLELLDGTRSARADEGYRRASGLNARGDGQQQVATLGSGSGEE